MALTLVLAGLSMFGPFNIDAPLPAFSEMDATFHVKPAAMQQIVSVYLLAFAVMSLFHGPISDAVGRKPVMTIGLIVYVVASLGCALSPSLPVLLVFRAFQGFAAGAGQIISRAVVRDLFDGAEAQRLMSQVSMIFGLAPAIAPVLGGFLLTLGDWRLIFWFLTSFGVLMTVATVLLLPETLVPEKRQTLSARSIVTSVLTIMRRPRFVVLAMAAALSFSGQFLYISNAPVFIGDLLGLGSSDFWVFFIPMVCCMIAGAWISGRLAGSLAPRRQADIGVTLAFIASLLGVVLTRLPGAHDLPVPIIGPSLIALGVGMSMPVLQLAMIDAFPNMRGAAASAGTFLNLVTSALLAGLFGPLVTTSLTSMAIAATCLVGTGLVLWNIATRLERRSAAAGNRLP